MTNPSGVRTTVKILVHRTGDGRVAVGILESEWHGARRVDCRLAAARPLPGTLPPAPRGVPQSLWEAYHALGARIAAWDGPQDWQSR